jgi:hypothetical protein
LVRVVRRGRERFYELDREPLRRVADWLGWLGVTGAPRD